MRRCCYSSRGVLFIIYGLVRAYFTPNVLLDLRRQASPGELALPPTGSRSLAHTGRRDLCFREDLLQSLDTSPADPRPVEVEAFQTLESRQRLD